MVCIVTHGVHRDIHMSTGIRISMYKSIRTHQRLVNVLVNGQHRLIHWGLLLLIKLLCSHLHRSRTLRCVCPCAQGRELGSCLSKRPCGSVKRPCLLLEVNRHALALRCLPRL